MINSRPNPQIFRIGSGGEVAYFRTLPVQAGAYNTGDVDENGDFWVAYQGRNWLQIRLSTLATVASGTATFPVSIYDWAYAAGGGNFLYTIAVDSSGGALLYRFNRATYV